MVTCRSETVLFFLPLCLIIKNTIQYVSDCITARIIYAREGMTPGFKMCGDDDDSVSVACLNMIRLGQWVKSF